jgi:hypothetical protein
MKLLGFLLLFLLCFQISVHSQENQEKRPPEDPRYLLLKDLDGFFTPRQPFQFRRDQPPKINIAERRTGYRVDAYIRVAAKLQEMGKEQGSSMLLSLAHSPERGYATFILARMLFVPRGQKEFRAPGIGTPTCLGSTDAVFWPLQPIALIEGIPFRIAENYPTFRSGIDEAPWDYVDYCIKNCDWNPYRFTLKSEQEKKHALGTLLATGPRKKAPDPELERNRLRKFLTDQIQ